MYLFTFYFFVGCIKEKARRYHGIQTQFSVLKHIISALNVVPVDIFAFF